MARRRDASLSCEKKTKLFDLEKTRGGVFYSRRAGKVAMYLIIRNKSRIGWLVCSHRSGTAYELHDNHRAPPPPNPQREAIVSEEDRGSGPVIRMKVGRTAGYDSSSCLGGLYVHSTPYTHMLHQSILSYTDTEI